MGKSMIIRGRPITNDIVDKPPATLELSIWAILFSLAIGVGLGYLGTRVRSQYVKAVVKLAGSVVFVVFIPALGLALQLLFSKYLGILPTGGRLSTITGFKAITGIYTLDTLLQFKWKYLLML